MKITPAFHTAQVTYLMNASRGDLMLSNQGDLHTRTIWDAETFKELPFAQHKLGDKLAFIGNEGWTLSRYGAQYILENCPPEKASDARKLEELVNR